MRNKRTVKVTQPAIVRPKRTTTQTNVFKPKFETGNRNLWNSLQRRNPGMKPRDIEKIGNDLLQILSNTIDLELPFGNLRPRPDGRLELNLWDVKKLPKK